MGVVNSSKKRIRLKSSNVLKSTCSQKQTTGSAVSSYKQFLQVPSESVDDFLIKCRIQADKCKFTADELKERLIEQLIQGTAHKTVQEKLLSMDDTLTVDKAIDVARTYEATKAHMEAFTSTTTSVDYIGYKGQTRNLNPKNTINHNNKCGKCGKHYLHKGKCPAQGANCNYCSKANHWEVMGRQKKRDNRGRSSQRQQGGNNRNRSKSYGRQSQNPNRSQSQNQNGQTNVDSVGHNIEQDMGNLKFEAIYIHNVNKEAINEVFVTLGIKVNDRSGTLKAKVDTGAQENVLPLRIFGRMHPEKVDDHGKPLSHTTIPSNTKVVAYNDTIIPHYGKFTIRCNFEGCSKDAEIFHCGCPRLCNCGTPSITQIRTTDFALQHSS